MPVLVTAAIETVPVSPRDRGENYATDAVSAEGATYEEARNAVRARIPDGWRVMNYRVERD